MAIRTGRGWKPRSAARTRRPTRERVERRPASIAPPECADARRLAARRTCEALVTRSFEHFRDHFRLFKPDNTARKNECRHDSNPNRPLLHGKRNQPESRDKTDHARHGQAARAPEHEPKQRLEN